ncbi:MAG: formamidopyrimidine-DNA glycosylase [Rhodomicrobium sp.]|nr:MAG: formamidopyrimidine-DNA glycosylase [Rhodomicrobium sp.]
MPELPEVETVMRGLQPHMEGMRLTRVEQRRENLRFPFPPQFQARLEGRLIERMQRRAKYILITLDSGEVLVLHLGMSGRFTVNAGSEAVLNPKHDHVVFHLSNHDVVSYNDPRRFGFMDLIERGGVAQHKYFSEMGPEPLGNEFDEVMLATKARARKTPLKSFLLDQKVVAGLGNIYVLEALYDAGLHPTLPAAVLASKTGRPTKAASRLVVAVRDVLNRAIEAGGSTLKDYAKADGSLGYFQHSFRVYGREGEACSRPGCSGMIERIVQAGRSSFFCPKCQK